MVKKKCENAIRIIEESTMFDDYYELIEFIKDHNIVSEDMFILRTGSVLLLTAHYCEENTNMTQTSLMMGIAYTKFANVLGIVKIIPKELLELFNIDMIINILQECEGSHAIDPEFKETKKYMQAELEYVL